MSSTIFVGRRKSSVARVRVTRGSGKITVNGREFEDYFSTEKMRHAVMQPFAVLEEAGKWDVTATIKGGGTTGQAGALRLGIARALNDVNDEWRGPLKSAGLLTRDARKVERKKYGLKKARKASQFSKR